MAKATPRPERTITMTPRFRKSKRGLEEAVQLEVDGQVQALVRDPLVGEPKTGALKGVRVVKFKVGPRQLLLAYLFHAKPNVVELIDVGVHENFYRDLQHYLRDRPR